MTPSAAAIVAATIAMGHSLGLTLIAEGVETPEQHRFLAAQGCERAQGSSSAVPMPAGDALIDRLEAGARRSGALHGPRWLTRSPVDGRLDPRSSDGATPPHRATAGAP